MLRQTWASAGESAETGRAVRAESTRLGPSGPGSNLDLPSVGCLTVGVLYN